MQEDLLIPGHDDDHDRGLPHDLAVMARRTLERRRLLGLFATGYAAALVSGCGGGSGDAASADTTTATTTTGTTTTATTTGTTTTSSAGTTTSTGGSCTALPQETNGPYPSDGSNSVNGTISNILQASGVVRSDIRSSFAGLTAAAAGVTTALTITLVNTNASCAPLSGYAIYLWHCDRDGRYSLYDLPAANYLRGVQVTDANGQATFTTIFPGAYAGRYPHMHFEIYPSLATATSYVNRVLTSQFAMPQTVAAAVYAGAAGYSASASRLTQTPLTSDNVFADNTAAQIAAMTPTFAGGIDAGFTGTVTVGLAR